MAKRAKRKPTSTSSSSSPSSSKIPKLETPENQEVNQEELKEEEAFLVADPVPEEVVPEEVVPEEVAGVAPKDEMEEDSVFVEESLVPEDEARRNWPFRYLPTTKKPGEARHYETFNGVEYMQAKKHYTQALIDGRVHFKLGDDGYVQALENEDSYICRVIEMFVGVDDILYFRAQWFYRAKDTIIGACSNLIDNKRIFLSEVKDDNPLDCLIQKLKIVRVPLNAEVADKRQKLGNGDYYYDMLYLVPYSTYQSLPPEDAVESDSTISVDCAGNEGCKKSELRMLDLYSGCGAMSTGLCLGANMADVNLVTRWAVDLNECACASLKLNHPETEVRNESAEDFLRLLREWAVLCQTFNVVGGGGFQENQDAENVEEDDEADDDDTGAAAPDDEEVFEVENIVGICYGDPKKIKERGLYLKVQWKGYGPEDDTWEPIDTLNDCKLKIKEFVVNGYKSKLLPLPGDCDVICGGPPCQGISGFNRFRNKEDPLKDEKNKQLVVYMDILEYLKPRFAIMENVVDIVKFAKGYLGRYALGRLVANNYQARVGLMVAGSYGLPQFRMRMFMWGAAPSEKLPQYPLPTHKVVNRGVSPLEFESNAVVHDEGNNVELERELFLEDAISDLPSVENDESRDEMPYGGMPTTEFQKFIRLKKNEMPGYSALGQKSLDHSLYDHRPLRLNEDDYHRVCKIPKKKGANFRDLNGVKVGAKNRVEWDLTVEREKLPSGKPLVPDYAMSFVDGRSLKPFGRLWWDETVPTVVTRAEPHNQAILHPAQDRVLTIRENARLQGFPDYYKLLGPIKERYIQVGNAVAVPVARALGYSLAMSVKGIADVVQPTFALPPNFPIMQPSAASPSADQESQ
ncbi:DNA (cytosine-5)-methyltransferase 3 [Artemisia annua]|uniref:DNA (cytosine-5-)-methyltransferase n=1 Tax=Artemisia annua TaxID=35608 RepID=A0A2U1LXY3_ARTAN|nr:DNA (cytosine-5)-methyltransferase 3 [Artemisia annua]